MGTPTRALGLTIYTRAMLNVGAAIAVGDVCAQTNEDLSDRHHARPTLIQLKYQRLPIIHLQLSRTQSTERLHTAKKLTKRARMAVASKTPAHYIKTWQALL